MARTIPHRELRNNSSAVLREVQNGETINITNNGEVVAVLVPPQRVVGVGLQVRRARRRGGFADLRRHVVGESVAEALDDLRGDR
jgi:prevent-host-death family protein